MSRDSQFTDAIEAYFTEHGRATVSEYQKAVGMSRQAAYQWRDRNAWRMNVVGKGAAGADEWVLLGVTPGTTAPSSGGAWQVAGGDGGNGSSSGVAQATGIGDVSDLEVGASLQVAGIRLVSGEIVVDLRTEAGSELSVNLGG